MRARCARIWSGRRRKSREFCSWSNFLTNGGATFGSLFSPEGGGTAEIELAAFVAPFLTIE